MVQFADEFLFNYSRPDATETGLDNTLIYFKQDVLAPARLAGSILLVHETMDQVKEPRRAWIYNVGQRRVRRAPNVAYDAPGTAADNMRTSDQFDMFNGAIDRYSWTLVGKQEMIVPYNSYRLHSDQVKYKDILTPLGAEKAGNAAGTIPAWDGGITTPPAGYQRGAHHPDPFAGDQPLFTITSANAKPANNCKAVRRRLFVIAKAAMMNNTVKIVEAISTLSNTFNAF